MSYKVPTADNSRPFEPLKVSKQSALQFLIMNSHVIFLNSPSNVRGFMERMYQEEVAQVKINSQQSSSQQTLTFGSQVINLQPPNLSSQPSGQSNNLQQSMRRSNLPGIGNAGLGTVEQNEGQLKLANKRMMLLTSPSNRDSNTPMSGVVQNQALQHIYKMQMLKEQNFPQSQLLLVGEKYAKQLRDHMRDFEKNQSRTRFILNFICSLQLLKKNALKYSSTSKYFLNRHKLMSMTTFANLIEQSMDLTFKCLFASSHHQALFFLNQLESQLSSLDEDMLVRYDSQSAIKTLFKSLYANTFNSISTPTPLNTIQISNGANKLCYHFPLRDQTYTPQELSDILFSMPNQDPHSLRGNLINQELLQGWQRTKSFMQVIGVLYNEDRFSREWGVDLREDRRMKSEIAAAAAARRERKGQEKDRKKSQVAAISALLSGLGKAALGDQSSSIAKNETQVYQQTQTYLTRAVRNLQITFQKLIHERRALQLSKPLKSRSPKSPSKEELIREVLDSGDVDEKAERLKQLLKLHNQEADNERRAQKKQKKRMKKEQRRERQRLEIQAKRLRQKEKNKSSRTNSEEGSTLKVEQDERVSTNDKHQQRLKDLGNGVQNLVMSVGQTIIGQGQTESPKLQKQVQSSSYEDKTSAEILKVIEIAQSILRIIDNPHFDFKISSEIQQPQSLPYKHSYYQPNPQGVSQAPRKFGRQQTTRPRSSKGKNQMLSNGEVDMKVSIAQGQFNTTKNQGGQKMQGGSPNKDLSLLDDDYFAGYRQSKSVSPMKREESSQGSVANPNNALDPLIELLSTPKNATALEGRRTFASRSRPTKFVLQPVVNTEAIRRNLLKNQTSQMSQGSNSSNTLHTPSSNLNVIENFSSAQVSGSENLKTPTNTAANKRRQFARFVGSQEFRSKGPALVPTQRESDNTLEESNTKSVESGIKFTIHQNYEDMGQQALRKQTDAESIEVFNEIQRAQSIASALQDDLPDPLDALRIDRAGERKEERSARANLPAGNYLSKYDKTPALMRNVHSAEEYSQNRDNIKDQDAALPTSQEERKSKGSKENSSSRDRQRMQMNQQSQPYLGIINSKNEYSPSEFSSSNQSPLLPQDPGSGASLGNQQHLQRQARGFSHNLSPISKLLKPTHQLSKVGSNEQHQSNAMIDILIARATDNSVDYEEGEVDSYLQGIDQEEIQNRRAAAQKARRSKEEHISQPLLKKHSSIEPKIMSRVTGNSEQLLDESGEHSIHEINDPNSPSVAGGATGLAIGKKGAGDKLKIDTQNDIIHEESFESSQNSRGGNSKSSKLKFAQSPDLRNQSPEEEGKESFQRSQSSEEEINQNEDRQDEVAIEDVFKQHKRISHGGPQGRLKTQVTLEQIYLGKTIVEFQIEREVAIVRNLFGIIKHDVFELLDYIRGSRFQWLNHTLVNMFNCLLTNRVPSQWLSCGYSVVSLKCTLSEWLECLVVKLSYLSGLCRNSKNEQYSYLDLSRLLQPSFILNQMIYRYLYQAQFISNNHNPSLVNHLDQFEIRAEILDRKITPIEMQKYLLKLKSDSSFRVNARRHSKLADARSSSRSDIHVAPFIQLQKHSSTNQGLFGYCKNSTDSIVLHQVFITGIKLLNARVDLTNGFLEDARTRVFEFQLPAMCLYIQQKLKEEHPSLRFSQNYSSSQYDSSDISRGIDIVVSAKQIPVAPTSKGYLYFENSETYEELFLEKAQEREKQETINRLSPGTTGMKNHHLNPTALRQEESQGKARTQMSNQHSQFDPTGSSNPNKQPQLLMKGSTATRIKHMRHLQSQRDKSEGVSNIHANQSRLMQHSSADDNQIRQKQNVRSSSQTQGTYNFSLANNHKAEVKQPTKNSTNQKQQSQNIADMITKSIKLTKLNDDFADNSLTLKDKQRGRNLTSQIYQRGRSSQVQTRPSLFHVSQEEELQIETLLLEKQFPYSEVNRGWRSRYTVKLNSFTSQRSRSEIQGAPTAIESETPTLLGVSSLDKKAVDKRKFLLKTKGGDSQRSDSDSRRNKEENERAGQLQASSFSQARQNIQQAQKDQNEISISKSLSIIPFRRREDRVFQVRIPLLIDFMVNARTSTFYSSNQTNANSWQSNTYANKQESIYQTSQFNQPSQSYASLNNGLGCLGEQLKYYMVFHSHFNQGYWDSVGAYAVCDPKSIF